MEDDGCLNILCHLNEVYFLTLEKAIKATSSGVVMLLFVVVIRAWLHGTNWLMNKIDWTALGS